MSNDYTLQRDVLDILFANRNKTYGAYMLRTSYPARLTTSLAAMMGTLILLSAWMEWQGRKTAQTLDPNIMDGHPWVHVIHLTPEAPPKPIPHPHLERTAASGKPAPGAQVPVQAPTPAPRPAPAPKRIAPAPPEPLTNIRVVDQPDIKKMVPPVEGADRVPANVTGAGVSRVGIAGMGAAGLSGMGVAGGKGTGFGNGDGAGEGDAGIADWTGVEVMPTFPGGEAALRKFLERRLQTPDELEAGTRVKVMVRFVVEKDGSISACTVDKSGGAVFDAEVLRVVREMPKWKPGIQNGRPVPVYFVLPVTFMRGED